MIHPRLLFDENLPNHLMRALRRRIELIELSRVGESDGPRLGSSDPEILVWCEANDWILVSLDRATMPTHAMEHLASGHHFPGVFLASQELSAARLLDDLLMIWESSDHAEWRDLLVYLPL